MRRKLQAAAALSRSEWAALMRSWWLLAAVAVGLRLTSLARVRGWLDRAAPDRKPGAGERDDRAPSAARLARLVGAAARHHLLPVACLERALVLQALLRRAGIDAELRIGVRREGGEIAAHAWVEQGGTPIGEPPSQVGRYAALTASQIPV